MSKLIKILIIVMIVIAIKLAIGTYYFYGKLLEKKTAEPITLVVPKATGINTAVATLSEKANLQPQIFYKYYAKKYAEENSAVMFAGTFNFPEGLTAKELIEGLFSNQYFSRTKITFPEGISFSDFASICSKRFGFDEKEFAKHFQSKEFLNKYGIKANNLEGYLRPDTYEFMDDYPAEKVLDYLIRQRMEFWDEERKSQASALGYSVHEIMTLASIVEAETPAKDELHRVSGLYHNRLRIGMLLQADPTVQFAKGEKSRVLYKDLEINNPYNTYLFAGLPPGPINNPGDAAIDAALNPEKHDYLYMVAVGDGTKRHNFAVSNAEHQKYVRIYRQNRRQQ